MTLDKITSAIISDLYSGLAGFNANETLSYEQISDEVSEKRQVVIKELFAKNLLKTEDLAVSLNCVDVECKDMVKCKDIKYHPNCDCKTEDTKTYKLQSHFEIPMLLTDVGEDAIIYIGSADGMIPFKVYYSLETTKSNQYRRRGNNEPFVYIDKTANSNQKHDCWLFNAPFVKKVKVVGVFKDLRQLEEYTCCQDFDYLDFGIISDEVKNRVKKDKFVFYRQNLAQPHVTDTTYR